MSDPTLRRVVLVGFMGAGKSSVGRRVADHLGWRFVDVDEAIEAREGLSIPEMFAGLGEAYFRRIEAEEADRALSGPEVVVATGGGWGAVPGRLESLPPGTRSVWLSVPAAEAVRRTSSQPGSRPLLTGIDALGFAERLIAERIEQYARADVEVDTDGLSVEDVSARVLEALGQNSPRETVE